MIDGTQLLRINTGTVLSPIYYSVSLLACDFDGSSETKGGVNGYSRVLDTDMPSVEYNIYGTTVFKSRPFATKYKFEWDLIVSDIKKAELEGLLAIQRHAIETRANPVNCEVLLTDNRIMLVDVPSTTRVFSETFASPTGISYGVGVFKVGFTKITSTYYLGNPNDESLWRISLEAVEL